MQNLVKISVQFSYSVQLHLLKSTTQYLDFEVNRFCQIFSKNNLLNKDAAVTVYTQNFVCYHHGLFYQFFGFAFICFHSFNSYRLVSFSSRFAYLQHHPVGWVNEAQVFEPVS